MPSEGSRAGIAVFADVAGPVTPPAALVRRVQGWAAGRTGVPEIQVRALDGRMTTTSLARSSGEDVRAVYPDLSAVRFQLETDCPPEACELVISVPGAGSLTLPWSGVASGTTAETPDARLFVEQVTPQDVTATSGWRRAVQQLIARPVAGIYAAALPVGAGLGAAGTLVALLLLRPPPWALLGLVAGSCAAIASRVALLAYLDATSIPAANLPYVSPAAPFVLILAVVGTWLGAVALLARYRTRPGPLRAKG